MVVSDLMTADVVSVDTHATVADVVRIMHNNDFRHVPVLSEGELVGLVSDRDVRAYTIPVIDLDSGQLSRRNMQVPVTDIMNTDTLSVGPESELTEVIDLMLEQKIGAVPVVDETTDKLVGIISYVDVLGAARDVL